MCVCTMHPSVKGVKCRSQWKNMKDIALNKLHAFHLILPLVPVTIPFTEMVLGLSNKCPLCLKHTFYGGKIVTSSHIFTQFQQSSSHLKVILLTKLKDTLAPSRSQTWKVDIHTDRCGTFGGCWIAVTKQWVLFTGPCSTSQGCGAHSWFIPCMNIHMSPIDYVFHIKRHGEEKKNSIYFKVL